MFSPRSNHFCSCQRSDPALDEPLLYPVWHFFSCYIHKAQTELLSTAHFGCIAKSSSDFCPPWFWSRWRYIISTLTSVLHTLEKRKIAPSTGSSQQFKSQIKPPLKMAVILMNTWRTEQELSRAKSLSLRVKSLWFDIFWKEAQRRREHGAQWAHSSLKHCMVSFLTNNWCCPYKII